MGALVNGILTLVPFTPIRVTILFTATIRLTRKIVLLVYMMTRTSKNMADMQMKTVLTTSTLMKTKSATLVLCTTSLRWRQHNGLTRPLILFIHVHLARNLIIVITLLTQRTEEINKIRIDIRMKVMIMTTSTTRMEEMTRSSLIMITSTARMEEALIMIATWQAILAIRW